MNAESVATRLVWGSGNTAHRSLTFLIANYNGSKKIKTEYKTQAGCKETILTARAIKSYKQGGKAMEREHSIQSNKDAE